MPRGPGERQVWRSLNGHEGESWIQPRRTWSRRLQFPEGRVSIARWNPKGMRRSTGLLSMGAAPKMNRSAKGGARSSLHYDMKAKAFSFTHRTKVFADGTVRKNSA